MLIPLPNDKDKDGPRLSPCQYDVHDITFQKFLGPHRDSGELPHGRVFRVKIGSSVYALKVVSFRVQATAIDIESD